MVKINPKDKKYIITFKPKDQRPNQIDDKLELFRSAVGLTEIRDLLDIAHYTGHHMTTPIRKTNVTVTDINSYEIPMIIAKLSPDQVEMIRRDPNVKFVEEDFEVVPYAEIPGYQITHLRAAPSWVPPLSAQGQGVKVAVMDSGCHSTHPDFEGAVRINQDFTGSGSTIPAPPGFHGSHCAGIVGARHNDIGMVGTAPQCELWNLKVLGGTGGSVIPEATQFAIQNGAHILSQSYGTTNRQLPQAMADACAAAINAGILIFASAGNTDPLEGGGFSPQLQMSYPAGVSGVSGISNTMPNKVLSNRSNYGPQVDFAAPGTDINSISGPTTYSMISGTSMSCPAVAGIAAVMLSAYQDNGCPPYTPGVLKWRIVLEVMKDTATKTGWSDAGAPGQLDPKYGWGVPQSDRAVASLKGVQVSALVA